MGAGMTYSELLQVGIVLSLELQLLHLGVLTLNLGFRHQHDDFHLVRFHRELPRAALRNDACCSRGDRIHGCDLHTECHPSNAHSRCRRSTHPCLSRENDTRLLTRQNTRHALSVALEHSTPVLAQPSLLHFTGMR